MKYRNLSLSFTMEDVTFNVLSISNEQMSMPIPKHSHSRNSYELHYISYGFGTLIADDSEYKISPGTFFMTGPQVLHEQISDPEDPMREYGVYLKVRLPRKGTRNRLLQSFLQQSFYIGTAGIEFYDLMKKLINELEQNTDEHRLMLSALLQELIVLVARLYSTQDDGVITDNSSPIHSPDDQTYLIIEEAFLYNYRDITLESLSKLLNLSRRQTERLLLQHYNKTFLQKKKEARMSAACILLQDKHKSIASVAYELGYSSPEHFTHAFKNYYNIPPSLFGR
ncbi:MAG: AraC family transcriptional regulator [Lachnospiraceae bacterium]|nr:AraC family transcriptional regulator [Lachnospiraceae bacterium]